MRFGCRINARDDIGCNTVAFFGIVPVGFKSGTYSVKTIQSVRSSDPEFTVLIFIDARDKIIADAVRIGGIIFKNRHVDAIITVQTVTGSKIHKPPVSLMYTVDGGIAQSVFIGYVAQAFE